MRLNRNRLIMSVAALAILFFYSMPCRAAVDHTDKITSYEGSKTCRACHEATVDEVAHVLHFRMLGETQGVYDFLSNKPVQGEFGKGNRY